MRLKKPLALTLAAIAALLLAVAVLWLGARTGMARRAVGDYLGELTGLPVAIGSMSIGFLPAPTLELGALAIAQPPGFGVDALLEAGQLRVAVSWGTMFGGAPVLRSVALSDATARPALAADGADNWSGLVERLSELGGEGPSNWSIGQLDIERGALEFHDAADDSRWRLTAITVGAQSIAPAREFPVELQFAGVGATNTFHFALKGQGLLDPDAGRHKARDLALRAWVGGDPLPLAGVELEGNIAVATYDAEAGTAAIKGGSMALVGLRGEFELAAAGLNADMRLQFSLKTAPFAPRVVATAFGFPLPATSDPLAYGSLQFKLEGRLEQGRLSLDPITGRLDDTEWSGYAIPQERLVRIQADRLDADRYFAPDQNTRKEKKATIEAALAEFGKLDIDLEIRIAEGRVSGARLRNALLKIERDDGTSP